ncbi:MAG: helix-turn-helix transcriptional regulator [Candidatus Thalassarchaeum sp.]|nr:helix-turn-helix transcriptional regulator [Candidatus Thalassarchaeum sp.]
MSSFGKEYNKGSQMLYRWRLHRNLTQRNVAELLDVDVAQISKLENGHRKPGRTFAVKMEQVSRGAITCGMWDDDPLPQHVVDPAMNPDFQLFRDGHGNRG